MKSQNGIAVCILLTYAAVTITTSNDSYIITNGGFSCDESLCLTINDLNQFSQMDRVSLEFYPGRHILSKSAPILFEDINEVHIIGHDYSTEIVCTNNSGFMLSSVINLVMTNISLTYCGGPLQASGTKTSAIFLHLVPNFVLESINLLTSTTVGIFISEFYGVGHMLNSVINSSAVANVVCTWGYSNKYLNATHSFDFTIENSIISHGGSLYSQDNIEISGGMNFLIKETEIKGNIMLKGITLLNNSGLTGGNLRINISQCLNNCNNVLNITLSNDLISHGNALRGAGLSFTKSHHDCGHYHFPIFNVTSASYYSLTMLNTVLANNQAVEKGGGMNICIDESFLTIIKLQNLKLMSNTVSSRPSLDQPKYLATGGGLSYHLVKNEQPIRNTPILSINQCTFTKNTAYSGAGVHIGIDTIISNANVPTYSSYSGNSTKILIDITASEIQNNIADHGAGMMFTIYNTVSALTSDSKYQVLIDSSILDGNIAHTQASGLLISSPTGHGNYFEFKLHNVSFINNRVEKSTVSDAYYRFSSTLSLYLVAKLSLYNCTFYQNSGSGIGAVQSRLLIAGFLNFSHNTAAVGSGMSLMSSNMEIKPSAFITFQQNHASEVGGAIYTDNFPLSCFYTIHDNIAPKFYFYFINNSANLGGSILYEQTLSNCTHLGSRLHGSHFHRISKITSQSRSLVASEPYQICRCEQNGTYNCDSKSITVSVIIGTPVILSLMITDQNGSPTPGFITFVNNSTNEIVTPKQALSDELVCLNITYTVASSKMSEHLILSPANYQHRVTGIYKTVSLMLSLLPCPTGFQISKTGTECECLPYLNDSLLQCSTSNFTITRLSKLWVGFDHNNTVSIYKLCPFNYCMSGSIALHYLSNNTVCIPERSGILCGGCRGDLSLTLGSDNCMECSNNFIALLLAFGALGIILVAVMTLFGLTITEGTVNGIIFCAAFLHLNRSSFFQQYDNRNFFVIFISWLNLDFGFNICFYNGLTSYAKIWLQFVFPIYLYTIEIIINISSYKSSKLARITGARNRLKLMSTIFLLGYMKMLRAVVMILSYARIPSLDALSDFQTVWLYDGNIEYYSRSHTPLLVVAILFLVIISIPYTSYLLLFQILQRLPHFPCELKRNGVGDAHVGPFKPKFRFWFGLLLFSYTILVILYYFTGGEKTINLTALVLTCSTLLLLKVLCRGVYKNKRVDNFESLLLFNVLLLSTIVLLLSYSNIVSIKIALYSLITVAFVLMFVSIVYTICTSNDRDNKVCANLFSRKPQRKSKTFKYPWSNDLSQDLLLNTFESEYKNGSNLTEEVTKTKSALDDSVAGIELVPTNWLPTRYSTPVYREDPTLLKSDVVQAAATHSDNSSEKSIPDMIKIKPSFLVVDNIDDEFEANLIPHPNNEISRSQRLSVDVAGDRTYIIEDHNEDQNGAYVSEERPAKKQSGYSMTTTTTTQTDNEKTGTLPAKVTHQPPVSSHIQQTIISPDLQRYNKVRRSSTNRQLHLHMSTKKGSKTRIRKRPQPGTICFKCDPSLFLQSKITRLKINNSGGKYSIKSHDITLKIPPSAIKEENASLIDLEVGVMLNGPFVFPQHIRPISPIVWICVRNKASLCKPIDITLPHFIKTLDVNDSKMLGMQFMKADHHARTLADGKKRFLFDRIGNNNTTCFKSQTGNLQTNHFCFLCIAALESRALYERASYCLSRADPVTWNPSIQTQEIHFIVSYNMETCLKVS